MQLYMAWYIRSFFGFTFLNVLFFSSTLVLTSSIDVVFILSIITRNINSMAVSGLYIHYTHSCYISIMVMNVIHFYTEIHAVKKCWFSCDGIGVCVSNLITYNCSPKDTNREHRFRIGICVTFGWKTTLYMIFVYSGHSPGSLKTTPTLGW